MEAWNYCDFLYQTLSDSINGSGSWIHLEQSRQTCNTLHPTRSIQASTLIIVRSVEQLSIRPHSEQDQASYLFPVLIISLVARFNMYKGSGTVVAGFNTCIIHFKTFNIMITAPKAVNVPIMRMITIVFELLVLMIVPKWSGREEILSTSGQSLPLLQQQQPPNGIKILSPALVILILVAGSRRSTERSCLALYIGHSNAIFCWAIYYKRVLRK